MDLLFLHINFTAMLKRTGIVFIFILFASLASSHRYYNPVTWDFRYEKTGDNQYELIFTATVEEGSHIYSMDIPEGGPIPTTVRIDSTSSFKVEGKAYEVTKPEEVLDEAFGMKIKTFSNSAEFRQKITALKPSFTVTGAVNYMACNNVTCSPPQDVEFEIRISDGKADQGAASNSPVTAPEAEDCLLSSSFQCLQALPVCSLPAFSR